MTSAPLKRWGSWLRRQVDGELARGLIKRGSAVLLMQVAGFGVQFLTGILLGRLLGATDYGRYSFAITLVIVFRIGVALGFPMMLLKTVAAYQGTGEWGRLKGLLRTAAIAMTTAGAALAIAVGLAANLLWSGEEVRTRMLLTIALPLILILPLSEAAAAAIKGLHRIALGQAPELARALLYLLALLVATFAIGIGLDARSAMILRVAAEALGLLVTVAILVRIRPSELRSAAPVYDLGEWRKGLLGFVAIDATFLVFQQIDILMLGTLRPMADVGVFRMATNLALVIQFVSIIAGIVLAPTVASAWAQGRRQDLEDICLRISRVGFAATFITFCRTMAISPVVILDPGKRFRPVDGAAHLARPPVPQPGCRPPRPSC
ncbi:MAG: oligosaccharide flippase family protein [Alphaproteobacteria bacterium]